MPDSPVASLATIRATSKTISVPNATATAASGWVRRHSTQRATTMLTARAVSSQVRSGRSAASMSDAATATPSSAQSRHTRTGGCAGRGSLKSARRLFVTISQA
jgi:hypothetical protein